MATTILAGFNATIALPAGNWLDITADVKSTGKAELVGGADGYNNVKPVPEGCNTRIGPFDAAASYKVSCFSGTLSANVNGSAATALAAKNGGIAGQTRKTFNGNIGTRIPTGYFANVVNNASVYTYELVLSLATQFDAIRVIFGNGRANATASSTPVFLATVYSGASFTDIDAATFTQGLLFGGSGVTNLAAPTNDTDLKFTVSDWLPFSSVARTDGGAGSLVGIRAYINGGSQLVMAGNGTDSYDNWASRPVTERQHRYRRSTATGNSATTAFSGGLVNYCPIVGVQYVSRGRVFTLGGVGDSLMYGPGGTYKGEGYILPAAEAINAMSLGYSVETANLGFAGVPSTQFYMLLSSLTSAGLLPDVLLYPPTSPNDFSTTIGASALTTARQNMSMQLQLSLKDTRTNPILVNFAPSNTAVKAYGSSDSLRVAFNAALATSFTNQGIDVFDLSAPLSGSADGTGQIQMNAANTTDGIHPNAAGNTAATAALVPVVLRNIPC